MATSRCPCCLMCLCLRMVLPRGLLAGECASQRQYLYFRTSVKQVNLQVTWCLGKSEKAHRIRAQWPQRESKSRKNSLSTDLRTRRWPRILDQRAHAQPPLAAQSSQIPVSCLPRTQHVSICTTSKQANGLPAPCLVVSSCWPERTESSMQLSVLARARRKQYAAYCMQNTAY